MLARTSSNRESPAPPQTAIRRTSPSLSPETLTPPATEGRIPYTRATASVALSAQVSIKLVIGPVPISGITLGVLLVGGLLGPRLGMSAAALYWYVNIAVYAAIYYGIYITKF